MLLRNFYLYRNILIHTPYEKEKDFDNFFQLVTKKMDTIINEQFQFFSKTIDRIAKKIGEIRD